MRIEEFQNLINSLTNGSQEKTIKSVPDKNASSFEENLNTVSSSSKSIPFTKDGFMSNNSSIVEMFKFFDIVNASIDPPKSQKTEDPSYEKLKSLISNDNSINTGYSFDALPEHLKTEIKSAVDEASKKYSIPKELIYAIIDQESSFNPYTVNHNKDGSTDRGLMQVNYDHNEEFMKELGVTDKNQLFDIKTNINIGTAILARDFSRYGNWPTAIKAYNGINADNWNYVKSVISKVKKYKNMT